MCRAVSTVTTRSRYLAEAEGRTVGALDRVPPCAGGSSWGVDPTARADGGRARPLHDGIFRQGGYPSFQVSWPEGGKPFPPTLRLPQIQSVKPPLP